MTHEEIIEKVRIKKQRMKWTNKVIGARSGISYGTVARLLRGENIGLYQLMDILDAMGLEINII